jgi:hypothetical protein
MDFEEQYDKLNQADKLVAGGWLLVCQYLITLIFTTKIILICVICVQFLKKNLFPFFIVL